MADAPNVTARWISEKYIGTFVSRLRGPFQLSRCGCKIGKVSSIVYGDEDVCVLGVRLLLGQGADQGNSPYAGHRHCPSYEAECLADEERANVWFSLLHRDCPGTAHYDAQR